MQKIKKIGLLNCSICKIDYTKENYPLSLKCGKTLCSKCHKKLVQENSKCPYDNSHNYLDDNPVKNLNLINIIENILENNKIENNEDNSNPLFNEIKPNNNNNNEFQDNNFIYDGPLIDNKPYGKGKIIYDNIGIFKGVFNGEFHKGKGQIFYDDGSSYKGEWEHFKRQNQGILQLANFDRYEGEFKDDLYEGKGKLYVNIYDNNNILIKYIIIWNNDLDITYEGFWRDGKKFGEFHIYNELGELIRTENYDNDQIIEVFN